MSVFGTWPTHVRQMWVGLRGIWRCPVKRGVPKYQILLHPYKENVVLNGIIYQCFTFKRFKSIFYGKHDGSDELDRQTVQY